jgi:hypothetical protein
MSACGTKRTSHLHRRMSAWKLHLKSLQRPRCDGKRHRFSVVASREVTFGGMGRSSRIMIDRREFIATATCAAAGGTAAGTPN